MRDLPSGTVTFLFTDIEGSTRLLHELGDGYLEALAEHRRALRAAFARHGGVEVDTQGDAFFIAFARAREAVAATTEIQEALKDGPIRVRMGLHTGEPVVTEEGYVGLDVHRAARIASAAHGGQALLSRTTRDLLEAEVELHDLGAHRLKDLAEPQRLYQLGHGEFPPLRSLNQSNLPVQPTALVGRERELGEVRELLRSHRLVTLTGTGGSGKTRLALQAAAELMEEFPDGVWFVSLAALREPELVEPTIVQTLGVKEPQTIEQYLEHKQALLLLDNFEHLLEAAPRLAVLRQAPKLTLLVTSRASLRLSGEYEYPVPPLSDEEATRLFVERARAAKPSFRPDAHVPLICCRLDNLPLALELAAACVKVLSPEALLARLAQRLPLLTGGPRDVPERQRTLRSTIEWSYELLNEEERRLFARLAIFAGGCGLEAGEEICEGTLDQFASLVDKSLVVLKDDRLSLHETIREFGLELLDHASEAEDLRRRHARFFVELFRSGEAADSLASVGGSFATVAGRRFRERVAPDLDNVRTALEWALAADEIELAVELVFVFYEADISARELATWYDRTLGRADSVAPATAAGAFRSAAYNKLQLGQFAEARRLCERSIALCRKVGDPAGEGNALRTLGMISGLEDRPEEARRCFEDALAIAEEHRLEDLRAVVFHARGEFEREVGHPAEAAELLMQSIELSRAAGNLGMTGTTLHGLGDLRLDEGNLDAADARYLEALAIGRELMYETLAMACLGGLAASAAKRGEVERAGSSGEPHSRARKSRGRLWEVVNATVTSVPSLRWPGRDSKLQWPKGRRAISMPSLKDC